MARIVAQRALPAGPVELTLRFISHGPDQPAEAILSSGGTELARGTLPGNALMPAGVGETFDIGRDLGVPVTQYRTSRGELQGDVPHLTIDFD